LYPLQVSQKDVLEWAYFDNDAWTAVDCKAVDAEAPEGIEKQIGFEGTPDPATGFYCVYNEGKLVLPGEVATDSRPASRKK
jgi:hypothetical protein